MAASTKSRLADFFVSRLGNDTIKFFQNNADTDAAPPYGVVTVTQLRETTPGSNVFRGEIKIAVITSIDLSSSREHDDLLESVMESLNKIPKRVVDEQTSIRMFGWTMTVTEAITKDDSQSYSDVITILCGCSG